MKRSVLHFPSKIMDFPKLFIIFYQHHKQSTKHIMNIEQYFFNILEGTGSAILFP